MLENDRIKDINAFNKQIAQKLIESADSYRQLVTLMSADVPIGVLGLPADIESILSKRGITRVFEIVGKDFSEIKGIGRKRAPLLTAALDQFLSMC